MVSTTAIAKYAGVSQTTVSRVLNKPEQVKKETYDKVMAAINEWGYSTEPKGKTELHKTVSTVRILAAANDPFIFTGALPAIVDSAAEQGLFVNIHVYSSGEKETLYDELVTEGTAGVLVSTMSLDDRLAEKLDQSQIPFVLLNGEHPKSRYSITLDYSEAAYLAASHLIETGHQEVAWVGGPLTAQSNKEGLLGFVHALQANKHKIRKKRLVVMDSEGASQYAAFESLLKLKKKPTAIVAATDEIAARLLEFYEIAGWAVPENVSIIGIGNSEAASGLTSVGMAATNEELGQEAISLLLHAINKEKSEHRPLKKEAAMFKRATTRPYLAENPPLTKK